MEIHFENALAVSGKHFVPSKSACDIWLYKEAGPALPESAPQGEIPVCAEKSSEVLHTRASALGLPVSEPQRRSALGSYRRKQFAGVKGTVLYQKTPRSHICDLRKIIHV